MNQFNQHQTELDACIDEICYYLQKAEPLYVAGFVVRAVKAYRMLTADEYYAVRESISTTCGEIDGKEILDRIFSKDQSNIQPYYKNTIDLIL